MLRILLLLLLVWLVCVALYQTHKKLPDNLNYHGKEIQVDVDNVKFLYDLTYIDDQGDTQYEQVIFDTLFEAIDAAKKYILIDMFLFNSYAAKSTHFHRNLSQELTQRLLIKKRTRPDIAIDLISDPINTVYGGSRSPELEALKAAGVNVILTDLEKLRDSNFIYSAWWRTFIQWAGNSSKNGMFKHPFSSTESRVSARSYLQLINFKANHRKVFLADNGDQMITILSSANPHGGSSAHSNVALAVRGKLWRSVYAAESAVATLSGARLSPVDMSSQFTPDEATTTSVMILSENQIKVSIIAAIQATGAADKIWLAQFYLADRDIIEALLAANSRDAAIKIILDPNKDAFGYEKNGIPNRQAAHELIEKSGGSIQLRWYSTHGEQFHTKLFMADTAGQLTTILGSANLTRRNLDNYNLELSIELRTEATSEIALTMLTFFDRIWRNEGGIYTIDFANYQETSRFKMLLYRIQEGLGLSTF